MDKNPFQSKVKEQLTAFIDLNPLLRVFILNLENNKYTKIKKYSNMSI